MVARPPRMPSNEPKAGKAPAPAAVPVERRERRRIDAPPMYTSVSVRVLARRQEPIEGHLINISETGLAVELDQQLPPGEAVAVEFFAAGLGQPEPAGWTTHRAAAEVVRNDNVEDFPGGPYQTALHFVQIGPAERANIARFIASRGSKGTKG